MRDRGERFRNKRPAQMEVSDAVARQLVQESQMHGLATSLKRIAPCAVYSHATQLDPCWGILARIEAPPAHRRRGPHPPARRARHRHPGLETSRQRPGRPLRRPAPQLTSHYPQSPATRQKSYPCLHRRLDKLSAALAQARAGGAFTAARQAFWDRARARNGDAAGTRALIEVLLLHRRMPAGQVTAGISAALAAGSCSPDVVAIEARKHAAGQAGGQASGQPWPALRPRPSRAAVVTLPRRSPDLPADPPAARGGST